MKFKELRASIQEAKGSKYKGVAYRIANGALYVNGEKIDVYRDDKAAEKAAKEFIDLKMHEATELQELSKKTLGSYVKKAADDMHDYGGRSVYHTMKANRTDGVFKDASKKKHRSKRDDADRKASNRQTGINRAVDRLTK